MIFYAPGLLAAGEDARLTSQIDIPPTLLDILNVPGDKRFFGESVYKQHAENRRAFISNYQELGYLKAGKLTVLGPKQHVETFQIDPKDGSATLTALDTRLRDEAVAYYQTASIAYKNGSLKMDPAISH